MMKDLVDWAVGVKDWRIDTIFHPRFRSPILHPLYLPLRLSIENTSDDGWDPWNNTCERIN